MKKTAFALFVILAGAAIAVGYYVFSRQDLISIVLTAEQIRIAAGARGNAQAESAEIEFRLVREGAGYTLEDDPHPAAEAVRRAVGDLKTGSLEQLLDGYCPQVRDLAGRVLAEQARRSFPYQSLAILPQRVDLIIQDGDITYVRFLAGEPVRRTIVFAFRHDSEWCEIPNSMFDEHMNQVAVAAADYGVPR